MSEELSNALLYDLLVVSLIASVFCMASSILMVGAKLTLRQYLKAAGVDGTTQIQSGINLRTYSLRIVVGLTFFLVSSLLIAEFSAFWRQWINRPLFVLLPLLYGLANVWDAYDERRQLRLELDLANITKFERAEKESLKQMTHEAIAHLETAAERRRVEQGKPKVEPLAAVIGEHESPITSEQAHTAEIATARARLTAATLALGLPARTKESDTPEPLPPAEQTLVDMGAAAEETRVAAEETVAKAEVAIEAIKDQQEKLEEDA